MPNELVSLAAAVQDERDDRAALERIADILEAVASLLPKSPSAAEDWLPHLEAIGTSPAFVREVRATAEEAMAAIRSAIGSARDVAGFSVGNKIAVFLGLEDKTAAAKAQRQALVALAIRIRARARSANPLRPAELRGEERVKAEAAEKVVTDEAKRAGERAKRREAFDRALDWLQGLTKGSDAVALAAGAVLLIVGLVVVGYAASGVARLVRG